MEASIREPDMLDQEKTLETFESPDEIEKEYSCLCCKTEGHQVTLHRLCGRRAGA